MSVVEIHEISCDCSICEEGNTSVPLDKMGSEVLSGFLNGSVTNKSGWEGLTRGIVTQGVAVALGAYAVAFYHPYVKEWKPYGQVRTYYASRGKIELTKFDQVVSKISIPESKLNRA